MSINHDKIKELILYVAEKCQFRENFGATMLNKILFFSDFLAFARFGESITGEEYAKREFGPAPRHLLVARDQLAAENAIAIQKRMTWKGEQVRIVPLSREANLSLFTPQQISLVDDVIDRLKDENAESVSDLSHKFYGWQITKSDETIPYFTIYLKEPKSKPPTDKVKRRIEGIIASNE